MKRFLSLVLIFLISLSINAQLTSASGKLSTEISTVLSSLPGNSGNDFALPSSSELNSWGIMMQYLLDHEFTNAANTANQIGYELIEFTDTVGIDQIYYLLKTSSNNYWGTYVYNPNFCRNLVIQAPHPKKDYNTGQQAIHVFQETNSMFYMVSGTSRCNHASFSSCSGSTTVCTGSSESFRISDLAHQMNTAFQSTTDTLFNRDDQTIFLQLHGFSKLTSDPFIILSNGTRSTPANDYIDALKSHLEAQDPFFIDSIKVAHFDLSWTRLIAFTNVQGRLINTSADICNTDANSTSGRFIHMEQEKTRLRNDETGWNKVVNAVNSTFDCELANLGGVHQSNIILFPNPAKNELTVTAESELNILPVIWDISGKLVNDKTSYMRLSPNSVLINISSLQNGIYFIRVNGHTLKFIKQ